MQGERSENKGLYYNKVEALEMNTFEGISDL